VDDVEALDARIVIIDLRQLRFVDSSGLGALIALRDSTRAAGRRLLLRRPPAQLLRLMSITQTYNQFEWG
jgi:anti-anti-sigma factor